MNDDPRKNTATSSPSDAPELPEPEDGLILVALRRLVLFPGLVLPVAVAREQSVKAIQAAVRGERPVGVVLQRDPDTETPTGEDLHEIGTIADVMRYVTAPDGTHYAVCQGVARFRVIEHIEGHPFPIATFERLEDSTDETSKEIEARTLRLRDHALEALELAPRHSSEIAEAIRQTSSPSQLADLVASVLDIEPAEKQTVLETLDVRSRLDVVLDHLSHQIEVLRLSQQIDEQTKTKMENRQREFLLRQQLETIRKELGEDEGKHAEIEELQKAIDEAEMPEEAEKQARKEIARLERMPEASMEYSMARTYLDWLVELPWAAPRDESIDIAEARRILDADHYGLEHVKKRILEFLAVRKLNPGGKSPILCFVGAPGVGKTSVGKSIAHATGRPFVRESLGGLHDEAEIRGHRRTYVGALPGKILQGIHKAGTRNPVFMLDEVDKLGAGVHGDPSSALLEVLDPAQNDAFRDNYLAVPFDLSRVMFIATANVLDAIPPPLRDRMEVIELPGYIEEEKLQIARRYLVARQLENAGLRPEQLEIADDALRAIVRDYTREAGCRNLERQIGAVCRHAAMRIAEGEADAMRVDADDLGEILGPRRFENEVAMRTSVSGVVTGLAWTAAGGDIMFIEASRNPGKGRLILTGHLGEVMKESAQAALSLVKARARELELSDVAFEDTDIHVHVPAGAIPKDGPSAGVTIYCALVSLLSGRTARSDAAMTGEISLRGLVLPVGGIKEKVVAAVRAGVETVCLPARNRKDLDEIPKDARDRIDVVWLETVDDAAHAVILDADSDRDTRDERSAIAAGGKR